MSCKLDLKKKSFLVYGLGVTGRSVINFFKKKKIKNFFVWDDKVNLRQNFNNENFLKLYDIIKKVDYIILSPGISLKNAKHRKNLLQYQKKIITDLDLFYLTNSKFKSIVITGSNGKSTTCKIIYHLLKKNNFKVGMGGNIGTPILNLKVKKNIFLVIEASSFQLSHSKFIHPNYAILLNITNDHLDWHGSMNEYVKSKFKIFNLQKKKNFALIDEKFTKKFKKEKYLAKVIIPNFKEYQKIKLKLKNVYLKSNINDQNMNFAFSLSKLLKIKKKSFVKSMHTFCGLPHRHEYFLRKKNITFINDSKATTFHAAKFALSNNKNIYWILGGLPKDKDKIVLKDIKKNIIKSYIIGKNPVFFKNQLKHQTKSCVKGNLKKAILQILKDMKLLKKLENTILLSPSAASFDQFKNFEQRGNEFKRLSKIYAKKFI